MILLASASPRRSALLAQVGVLHEIRATDVDETARDGEDAASMACRLARDKALEGRRLGTGLPVLGADTVVVLDGQVFGKPVDAADGARMLRALGGHTHHVITAVALALPGASGPAEALSDTAVTMRAISAREAQAYWNSGEPVGKAGGYAIQGLGAMFIERIEGSYSGVMGLPLYETMQLLQAHGLYGGSL